MREKVIVTDDFATISDYILEVGKKALVVSDNTVYKKYGHILEKELTNNMECVDKIILESGEKTKSFESIFKIYEKANIIGVDKNWVIIALGGGVIGDLSGFAASTYKRGVKLIHIPTTLLSQIDSSIGGKTGVNFDNLKNNIGTIHQSKLTYINIACLKTLNKRQYIATFGELAKYAIIYGGEVYESVFLRTKEILEYDHHTLQKLIYKCVNIKQDIVEEDLDDIGARNILNLGHTLGHALESKSDYDILHGEAILLGLLYACKVSKRLGHLKENLDYDVENLIKFLKIKYPSSLIKMDLIEYFKGDKKFIDEKIRFVLPYAIGDIRINSEITQDILISTINDLTQEDYLWI